MSIFKSIKEITLDSLTNTANFITGATSNFVETVTDIAHNSNEHISNITKKGAEYRLQNQMSKLDKKSVKLQKETIKLLEAKTKLETEKLFTNK